MSQKICTYINLLLLLREGRRGGKWWDFNTINCTVPYRTHGRYIQNILPWNVFLGLLNIPVVKKRRWDPNPGSDPEQSGSGPGINCELATPDWNHS
jgi:hypothetical protein